MCQYYAIVRLVCFLASRSESLNKFFFQIFIAYLELYPWQSSFELDFFCLWVIYDLLTPYIELFRVYKFAIYRRFCKGLLTVFLAFLSIKTTSYQRYQVLLAW